MIILFYFRFLNAKKSYKSFINIINSPDYYNFRGLSFEIICLKHIEQIKSALGIRNVDSKTFSMFQKGNDLSLDYQIDMFIDRDDQIINLLEMKYCNDKYELSSSEVLKLQNRVDNLMKISKYKKGVQVTIVTPYGLVDNSHSSFISSVITLNDLFNN